jgi:release factor glutamine methyltransferase
VGKLLSPGGLAAIEIGFDQAKSATALFEAQGMEPHVATDFGGRARTLLIRS